MTPLALATCAAGMSLVSFGGALAFKQFNETKDVLFLVAGFCAYGLSNVAFIMLMGQTGIARAMVLASVAQIVLSTVAGLYLGERVGITGLVAAGIAFVAVLLTLAGPQSHQPTEPDPIQSTDMEKFDV